MRALSVCVVSVLLVLLSGWPVARATDPTCTIYNWGTQQFTSKEAAGAAAAAVKQQQDSAGCTSQSTVCFTGVTAVNCKVVGASWFCDQQQNSVSGPACPSTQNCGSGESTSANGFSGSITTGACPPNPCTAKANTTQNLSSCGTPPSGTVSDPVSGCEMTVSRSVSMSAGGTTCSTYDATYTGRPNQGSPSGGTPADCVTSASGTFCSEKQSGKNCGTINGDEVCPAAIPPGTCVSFQSGGVACTATAPDGSGVSPPAPNNGTPGQAATPTGSVATKDPVTGASTTTNYYSSSVVGGGTSGVPNTPGGKNVGNGGTGSGSGSGTGTGSTPSAANGDCGATGVSCSGDGATPGLPNEPTIAQSTQTYTSLLSQVPVVAAVSNIAASVPSGQCPTGTMSLFGHEFVMDAQCTLWSDLTPLLGACFLAMWTFIGVRIVMSA
jgi:hypothetical protein